MNEGWTEDELARRVAQELPDGACVNLGIGMPTKVARHVPANREILFHSENGIIGMGPDAQSGLEDPDVVNAGKKHVTLVRGASIVHQADSFSLIRGGRLDIAVLGGLQVSAQGDLANWKVPSADVGGVGGAMDLAVGARKIYIMMRHVDKHGRPKLVSVCTYPLTASRCVTTVFTDLGVFDCRKGTFFVRELAPGVSREDVSRSTQGSVEFG